MSHFHAVIWLDHSDAKVFQFNPDQAESHTVHSGSSHPHLHHRAGVVGSGKAGVDAAFFAKVAHELAGAGEILVIGPGTAKQQFVNWAEENQPALHKRIVAVEAADHPTGPEIVKLARERFRAIDRMLPRT